MKKASELLPIGVVLLFVVFGLSLPIDIIAAPGGGGQSQKELFRLVQEPLNHLAEEDPSKSEAYNDWGEEVCNYDEERCDEVEGGETARQVVHHSSPFWRRPRTEIWR